MVASRYMTQITMAWWRPDRKISNDLRKLVDIKDLVQLLLTINHTQSTMDSLKVSMAFWLP